MKMVFISVTAVAFLYSSINAAVSDSFWSNAPMIIGAITVFITALVAGVIKLWTFLSSLKKEVKDYHTQVNSKMDLLLKEKDDKAKAIETAKVLADAIVAAKDKGKLEAIEEMKKEELLKKIPPPTEK